MNSPELSCVYAALILHDDLVEITAEKISTLLSAANVQVEPYWPGLFAKALDGVDIKSLLCNVGVGSGAPSGGSGNATGNVEEEKEGRLNSASKKHEESMFEELAVKEVVKEESEEESDDDMGFGLFD